MSAPFNMFNRQTNVRAFRQSDGRITIDCLMSDTFHEISVSFVFNRAGEVLTATGAFLRSPYDICTATASQLARLSGLCVGPGSSKQVRAVIGGGEGCEHLVEVTLEVFRAFVQCRFRLELEEDHNNDPQAAYDAFTKKLKDSCYPYSHVERIGEIRWWSSLPKEPEKA